MKRPTEFQKACARATTLYHMLPWLFLAFVIGGVILSRWLVLGHIGK